MRLFLIPAFLLTVAFCSAQDFFPSFEAKSLEDKAVKVPEDLKGKISLLGFAYSKKADEDLRAWFQPAYTRFINPPQSGLIPSDPFEGNIYFIPMLQGIAKKVSGKIEKEMKEGIDPSLHPHIALFSGEVKDIRSQLKMDEPSEPYFFVIDENGKILYRTQGAYTDDKMDEIESYLEE